MADRRGESESTHPLSAQAQPNRSRRLYERRRTERVRCDVGTVLDLSRGGARILSSRRPFKGQRVLRFTSAIGTVRIEAAVAWSRRLGFRKYLIGLQFIGVSPRDAHLIAQVMREAGAEPRPSEAA